jgi:hypothetical protein
MGVHDFIRGGLTTVELIKVSIFPVIIFGLIWYPRHLYDVVTATDSGLRSVGPFGRETRIKWDEITSVRTPRWRVPRNFTYIFSKTGQKIIIINGMLGYSELLRLIDSRAGNLTGTARLQDLWPDRYSLSRDWKILLIVVGVVALYTIARIILNLL